MNRAAKEANARALRFEQRRTFVVSRGLRFHSRLLLRYDVPGTPLAALRAEREGTRLPKREVRLFEHDLFHWRKVHKLYIWRPFGASQQCRPGLCVVCGNRVVETI
jgi:hypothetical protein